MPKKGIDDYDISKELPRKYPDLTGFKADIKVDESSSDVEEEKPPVPPTQPRFENFLVYGALVIGLIAAIVVNVLSLIPVNTLTKSANPFDRFQKQLLTWKNSNSDLMNDRGWKMVNKTVYYHFLNSRTPTKPAIINVVGHPDNVRQFHRQLTDVLVNAGITKNCDELPLATETDHEDIMNFIGNRSRRCVFVQDLNKIQPSLRPTLHALSDDQHAPHKDVLLVFSITAVVYNVEGRDAIETLFMDMLRDAWVNDMGYERCEALLAKLAYNVIRLGK